MIWQWMILVTVVVAVPLVIAWIVQQKARRDRRRRGIPW